MAISIGENNNIASSVIIYENVIIGNNNFIGENVILYPNTIIGNNNNIFNGNIIGEFPVNSDDKFKIYDLKTCKGVSIGNNNLFHVKNIIFAGIDNPTFIGNNNKLLAEIHISHDVYIGNNVTFYPKAASAGYCRFLDYSNIGMSAVIHQKRVVGQYTMIGANCTITKNAFPYFIHINNKITRLNKAKISNEISENEISLRKLYINFLEKNYEIDKYNLPQIIKNDIYEFIENIKKI